MYHPSVISKRLDEYCKNGHAKVELTERQQSQGVSESFEPTYHNASEIAAANAHFDALVGDDGHLKPDEYGRKREFSAEERKWIANEVLLCRMDFLYFATRYATIKDVQTGQLKLFEPNVAQRILHSIRAEHELRGSAIEMVNLKARQLGVSTDSEVNVGHRTTFWAHTTAVVASSDPDKSDKMSRMLERIWDHLPWWMMPQRGVWVAAKGGAGRFEFPRQYCSTSIQHGSQFTGISRGDTVDIYHLSEVSNYPDPAELIDAALMNAVHPNPFTFGILESTAFEKGDWFNKKWNHCKNNWPRGRSRLRPCFLPWYVGTDLWPTPTWLHDHPVPVDWEIPDYIIHHAERARAYVRADELLRKYLGADWKMPLSQMWYYDCAHAEAVDSDALQKFLAEMASDDVDAFQSRNVSVFSNEVIQWHKDQRRDPYETGGGVYGLVANIEDIPQRLQPSARHFDPNRKPISIKYAWGRGSFECTMQPLLHSGMVNEPADGLGKIYVWHPPEPEGVYALGVDTSDGVGRDRSVIEGMLKADMMTGQPDQQVFEFASDYVNAHDMWPFVLALGVWYSGWRNGLRQQPRVAIECLGNGEVVQKELKLRGWTNFHPWIRYDNKSYDKGKARKLGVYTNSWFRPMVLDCLIKWLRDGWLTVNSPYFIEEMETLERNWDRQDSRAMDGSFDDRIMAMGFALITKYDTEIRKAHSVAQDGHAMSRLYESRAIRPDQESKYAYYRGTPIPVLSGPAWNNS